MSEIENPEPHVELTGQALIRDFRVAMDISGEIGKFESWALDPSAGVEREVAISAAQSLLNLPSVLPTESLDMLLSSDEERAKMDEIIEQSREINLERFIGQEAVFRTDVAGTIKRFVWAGSYDRKGTMVPSGSPLPNPLMSDITSLLPAEGIIRIGENHNRTIDRRYSDIRPFDPTTGDQVVEVKLTK